MPLLNARARTQPISLSGSGSLTVFGGELKITGTNTYTGATIVSFATLSLDNTNNPNPVGTGLGSVTVGADSKLDGTGSTVGSVTINADGILDPGIGLSTSILKTGSVSLANGAAPTSRSTAPPSARGTTN